MFLAIDFSKQALESGDAQNPRPIYLNLNLSLKHENTYADSNLFGTNLLAQQCAAGEPRHSSGSEEEEQRGLMLIDKKTSILKKAKLIGTSYATMQLYNHATI